MSHYILVAEDEADIRDLLRLVLEATGYVVEAEADGDAAWERARVHPPRLLVTDLRMPTMDGLELIRAVRQEPTTQGVPVILFTAYVATDPRVDEARRIAGVEVVTKGPIAELREAVGRALAEPGNGFAAASEHP
ncbi:MAG TPA: response regulator [Candidatus Binatia bacterium]|nr:response regulator [Candidatus Binatia bacterium]